MKFPKYIQIPIDAVAFGGRGSSMHAAMVKTIVEYLFAAAGKGVDGAEDIHYAFDDCDGASDSFYVRLDNKQDMHVVDRALTALKALVIEMEQDGRLKCN
jgi:hypothetical protein